MTLIASDLSKLRVKLVERDRDGIWQETSNPAYSPVIRKPNAIQTRVQFWENWWLSKLSNGNVYALKVRDNRRVVTALYILDPQRVQTLVSDSGDVFYRLSRDEVSRLQNDIIVPAEEIIHDRMNCLFHPLIGVSPIVAAGLAAMQGLNIQTDATLFFKNLSLPSGILSAPGAISNDTASRLKEQWQENYGGTNAGKVAVLGDGLKFEQMRATARDSQVIEQLRWSAEVVCSVFHVPPYKIGVGPTPSYNNIQALNLEYYSQALQILLEAAELSLDEGLAMADGLGTEFDLDGLLRMDTTSQVNAVKEAVGAGIMSPNEARAKLDLKPVEGGETPWLQQQNWPIARLAERTVPTEASPNPAPDEEPEPDADPEDDEPDAPTIEQQLIAEYRKHEATA
jgi:HK97 family phage portal protein